MAWARLRKLVLREETVNTAKRSTKSWAELLAKCDAKAMREASPVAYLVFRAVVTFAGHDGYPVARVPAIGYPTSFW